MNRFPLKKSKESNNSVSPSIKNVESALEIAEKSFGKDSLYVAMYLNNLEQIYKASNRLEEAEPLIKRALKINEMVLGNNHPNVAIYFNNLAQLYKDLNRLQEAKSLAEQSLQILIGFSRKNEQSHPNLGYAFNNYIKLLISMGYSKEQVIKRLKELMPEGLDKFGIDFNY